MEQQPATEKRAKILVVDDSLVIVKILSLKLKSQGYEVLTAGDGPEAIATVRRDRPDLILLDLNFPPDVAHGGGVPWDGFLVIDWLRRLEGGWYIPIIVITGEDAAKVDQRALAAGAVKVFHKPIDQAALLVAIRETLASTVQPPAPAAPSAAAATQPATSTKKFNIAVVGLGFGAEFIPIWQKHPSTNCYAICQRNANKLHAMGDHFGVATRHTDFQELLKDKQVDAVHINSPIPDHAWMSIAALEAGKHVACTGPMATTLEECKKIVDLVRRTRLKYMMMETAVYSREYLYLKQLLDQGDLGKLQFVQATHQQDMDGWPNYWPGLPPMWYATHCVGPVAGLIGKPAEYVSCFGSGTIRKELVKCYGSRFAVETAHIKFRGSDVNAHIIRSLFDTARQYRQSIDVYGTKKSVEWPLISTDPLVMHTAKLPEPEIPKAVRCPDFAHRLPTTIAKYTTVGVLDTGQTAHLKFTEATAHGGSHPHLVHEFATALVENREPFPNAKQSANWTCVGLCAHESALKGGPIMKLPTFTYLF